MDGFGWDSGDWDGNHPSAWVAVNGEDEFALGAGQEDGLVEDEHASAHLDDGETLAVDEEFD